MAFEILETTNQVMDALGGNGPVEILTSSRATAVSNWRGFATFPSKTYVVMIGALHAIGKTAPPSLWGMMQPAEAQPSEQVAS